MKRMLLIAVLAACFTLPLRQGMAEVVFYVDFDDIPSATYNTLDAYPLDTAYEVAKRKTNMYFVSFAQGAAYHDGVVVKVPDGSDGTNFPSTPGPQGGKVMLLDAGKEGGIGCGEGLWVEIYEPWPVEQDMTWEIVFWPASNNLYDPFEGLNTNGIQALLSDEWPYTTGIRKSIRIVGDPGVGVQKNKVECAVFNPSEINIGSLTAPALAAKTWHTLQVVYDFNDADPAQSTFTMYLDGALYGGPTIVNGTRTSTRTNIWGLSEAQMFALYIPDRQPANGFLIGVDGSITISGGSDRRGLLGAIDAVAISTEALAPGSFILPDGYTPPPPPASAQARWLLYE